ncbi:MULTISPECIES: thioesterase family protein [Stappia]|jgi:acyl-CoA thioester hydrolase|uniref:Thioesterase n=1 Tax=Stappia indica TaxID=538381 RepID=A0A857C5L8_9HYPH|nr:MULTISPECIES: thioesterase family protein [Stappia]MBC2860443.1 thioesterase family protein [Stappia sp. 28M-7]MCC4243098.1 thioesterase family protein [Stappia indica]QGZ34207.1 thioesterase [Stappia indica]
MSQPSRQPAPFTGSIQEVRSEWLDYNGHLNMAYYNVLFDTALDEAFIHLGLGPDYARERGASFFTAETHLCYLRELNGGDRVRATVQLVDFDAKRAHLYQELHHADDGFLSATSEQVSLHVDLAARKVVPWPQDVLERLEEMRESHAVLGRPERSGRRISLERR